MPTDAFAIAPDPSFPDYERHRPENTVLYNTIAEHWKTFLATLDQDPARKGLPQYVRQEFDAFLKCGVLAYGFLRVQCEGCEQEKIVGFSCKKRGFCPSCGGRKMAETAAFLVDQIFPKIPVRQWVLSFPFPIRYLMAVNPKVQSAILKITLRAITGWLRKKAKVQEVTGPVETGAVTLIQRIGGSVNLNLHFHKLVLEGVYVGKEEPSFLKLPPPTDDEVKVLLPTLSIRLLRWLTRLGTMEACFYEEAKITGSRCAALGGFSLHADTACEAWERDKLERLCRYVARPAIANERLFQRPDGLPASGGPLSLQNEKAL